MKFYQTETGNVKNIGGAILRNPVVQPAGEIFSTTSRWTWRDYWGEFLVRTTSYRNTYTVKPGIYRLGNPDEKSPVLVSANYKLSFDILRKNLSDMNVWILVLDTKGVNVWCAAGKGTFGTDELVKRIGRTNLSAIVNHKKLIVPQLGAVGVSAPAVKKLSGFSVTFGPVYASDIPEFMENDMKATPEMRRVRFSFPERLVLIPMELIPAFRYFPWYAMAIFFLFGLHSSGILFRTALEGGTPYLISGLAAILAGAFLTPAFLPFIPSRAFSIKGWVAGLVMASLITSWFGWRDHLILVAFVFLFVPMMSSFIALQFTGSTTYTSQSGVKKELKYALPVYMVSAAISVLLIIYDKVKIAGWL